MGVGLTGSSSRYSHELRALRSPAREGPSRQSPARKDQSRRQSRARTALHQYRALLSSARRKKAGWALGRIGLRIAYYKIDRCVNTRTTQKKVRRKTNMAFLNHKLGSRSKSSTSRSESSVSKKSRVYRSASSSRTERSPRSKGISRSNRSRSLRSRLL